MSVLLSSGKYFGIEAQKQENSSCKINVTRYEPFMEVARHCHENPYFSVLIHGNYYEMGEKENKLIGPGQILFRPSGYEHANKFLQQGGRCFNIEFKKELVEKYELSCKIPAVTVIYKTGDIAFLYKAMFTFCRYDDMGVADEFIGDWLASIVQPKITCRLIWLPKVKDILENEFHVYHTIHSMAERVFIHPIYLARAFKDKEGVTFGEYQLKVRLRKCLELLFKTNLNIDEIAYLSGFTDAPHLIRSFRLHYQLTPAKFRSTLKSIEKTAT